MLLGATIAPQAGCELAEPPESARAEGVEPSAQQTRSAVAAQPEAESVVVLGPKLYGPPGTPPKQLQIRYTASTGLECKSKMLVIEDNNPLADPSTQGTEVSIKFLGGYSVALKADQTALSTLASCLIQLKIEGAPGFRFNVARLTYAGSMNLPNNTTKMGFVSSAYWRSSQFSIPEDAEQDIDQYGPYDNPWAMNHQFESENTGWSKCLTADADSDALMIEMGLLLKSRSPVNAQAVVSTFSARADADGDTAIAPPGTPGTPSNLAVRIEREPCDPS